MIRPPNDIVLPGFQGQEIKAQLTFLDTDFQARIPMAQKRQIASHASDKGNNRQTRTRQQKWPAGQERYVSRHWAAELTRFLCLKPCRASNLLKLRSIRPRPLPRIVRVSFSVYPRHLARRAPCDQHDAPIQLREHTHRRPILSPFALL